MAEIDRTSGTETYVSHEKFLSAKEELKAMITWKKGFEAAGKTAPMTYSLEDFFSLLERNLLEDIRKKNKGTK